MKKDLYLLLVLFMGLSSKSFAGTGSANDQIGFVLVILAFLSIIAGFFAGKDYLQKNGKTMARKAIAFIKKKIALFRSHHDNAKSDYLEQSYF